jgi:hypothetical protein
MVGQSMTAKNHEAQHPLPSPTDLPAEGQLPQGYPLLPTQDTAEPRNEVLVSCAHVIDFFTMLARVCSVGGCVMAQDRIWTRSLIVADQPVKTVVFKERVALVDIIQTVTKHKARYSLFCSQCYWLVDTISVVLELEPNTDGSLRCSYIQYPSCWLATRAGQRFCFPAIPISSRFLLSI